ncbi:DUF937 domain-containing protein [Pasteurellaceae bacterium HPA106]|uniref:YidB family protein n=1 Tax=Spirabiliibacterium pneumoniae TaxID=221400 RepID=UPI001AADF89E|nr:YidB family protein [Spirabiliibacterium pneumoniae]MBE2895554.1 DUF937 domain-containing protein [Spirabiliibacterium pneumoniae]
MFEKVVGSVLSGLLGQGKSGQSVQAMQLINALLNSQGGLQGLLAKLQQGGLGDLVQSWLGQGENKPVSPQEIDHALGSKELEQAAQQAGLENKHQASDLLSQFLPQIVDKFSPNGHLNDANNSDLLSKGIQSVLGGLFKK